MLTSAPRIPFSEKDPAPLVIEVLVLPPLICRSVIHWQSKPQLQVTRSI